MGTTYILRVYWGKQISECDLTPGTPCTAGCGGDDTLHLEGGILPPGAITATTDGSQWRLRLSLPGKDGGWQEQSLGRPLLVDQKARIAVIVYERGGNAAAVSLQGVDRLCLGRGGDCEIQLGDRQVSERHLELTRQSGRWTARDLGSSNGVYRNGTLAKEAALGPGDRLDLGLSCLWLEGETLYIQCGGGVKTQLTKSEKRSARAPKAPKAPASRPKRKSAAAAPPPQEPSGPVRGAASPNDNYPCQFRQSPRLREQMPHETMELQAPPSIGGKPEISWFNVLLAPLLTVGVMAIICLVLGGPMTMLVFSAPMTMLGAVMALLRLKGEKKKYAAKEQLRLDKYNHYLDEQMEKVQSLQADQRRILCDVHPSPEDCVDRACQMDRRLWERRPADDDFLTLRLGTGQAPSCVDIRAPRQTLSLEEDRLADRPSQLARQFATVDQCPVTADLRRSPTLGIIGSRNGCISMAKCLLVQAAAHHSYEDLRILLLCSPGELPQWSNFRWLPHVFDDTRSDRFIAVEPANAAKILTQLQETLAQRYADLLQSDFSGMSVPTPYYLVVCADASLPAHHGVMKYLTANDPRLGVGAVFLYDRLEYLPKECQTIVDLTGAEPCVYPRTDAGARQTFQADALPPSRCEQFCRAMAPIRMEPTGGRKELPTSISFLQGYGVKEPRELPVLANWNSARPEAGMAVPLGVGENGKPFLFDIHEKRHGPHGLVGGTTGSGKSEMVQSWILSMALKFPPSAVSFVLIDFKGTGLLTPFKNLPHLAGTISNLDTTIDRNLVALENELTRREALLGEAGLNDISKYLKRLHQGEFQKPLPYLFIIIDEFAEFKGQFPEFMQVVNRIFAIGRALGVYILLLTQKPGSVVDEKMSANTKFRWCLKVANSADSKDMLHHPDAARITNPGRAYVQVGEDEVYAQIQSYWSGAPYNPYRDPAISRARKLSVVDITGRRTCYEAEKTTGYRSDKEEIDAVVNHLDDLTRRHGIPRADAIWTQALPEQVSLNSLLQVAFDGEHWADHSGTLQPPVGLVDDPRSQSQYPLKIDFPENGHLAVYGLPGSGKTTLLQSLILSLALSYGPDVVSLYLLDFGNGSLNLFRKLPHVGGVALADDQERIDKLMVLITRELTRRRKLLADLGLVNITSYQEVTGETLPYMVVILDNFAPVKESHPELEDFFKSLSQEGAACGIYLVLTANAPNLISMKISQNITNILALQMKDRSDYSSVLGSTPTVLPGNLLGRGLAKGKPHLEFQTALPTEGATEAQRVIALRQLVELMDQKWTGPRPAPIPVMPDVVRAADYPGTGLFAGLACESVEPCTVDLEAVQFLAVSRERGGTGTFHSLCEQAVELLHPERTLVCGEISGLDGAEQCRTPAQFDGAIASLMPVLQERKIHRDTEGTTPPSEEPWLLVVLPDVQTCFDGASNDTMRRLASIVNLGKGLHIAVLAAGKAAEMAKLYHSGEVFTMALVQRGAALLCGGTAQAHSVFQTDLGYTEASAALGAGEGYLLLDGTAQRLRLVEE